ncbi:HAD-IA family hydrolase [Paracoccus tegillarcae]|uniref:Hydrolase n=1 Tax=Paracoccus tegillarcae TaxID=1529068 RepID=A0A2K9ELB7_9RHOB|nr:HAD-IA family hydrolase [Paracoccus tegillarcae]AUH35239.1 hydrolase [Paracoccus tegillarcae]
MGRALIFDCDGVLIDSEVLSMSELLRVIQDRKVPINETQAYDLFLGTSATHEIACLRDRFGVDITADLPIYQQRLARRFSTDLQPINGIAKALANLPGPRAVASSSNPERLRLSLGLTGLWDSFAPHVYSATMVANGKPAPDLFLLAARQLGVAPGDCIVIEDSPAGIRAARAAGMRVVGFLGGSHAGPARLADKLAALQPDALVEHAENLVDTLTRLG